jgi:hypothetical protein
MKYSDDARKPRTVLIICVALIALGLVPFLSSARTTSTTTSVTIVNDSHRDVRNAYTSHVDADDWSANLLTGPIAPGQSATVSGFACDGQQVKVIGEDQDGCFVSIVISCGSSGSWTVNDQTTRDCGY